MSYNMVVENNSIKKGNTMQIIITSILSGKTTANNFDFSKLSHADRTILIDTLLVSKLTLLSCGLYTSEYQARVESFSEALTSSLTQGI